MPPRILLLASAHSYRPEAFLAAAARLGVDVVRGLDAPPAHVGGQGEVLRLDFRDPARAVRQARRWHDQRPWTAIIPTDDATVVLAAHMAEALGLRHNGVRAAEAARDKHLMRRLTAAAGLPSPKFLALPAATPAREAAALAAVEVGLPCVVKPTQMSGSRGVIRADDALGLEAAWDRAARLALRAGHPELLVESFIPGQEYALEGLLRGGQLTVLAIFDKPDPLDGPYFEETIYVTPSRAAPETQAAIAACVAAAARALDLREGAVHGEVRVNADGAWLIEVAGRSIGGLCGQTLRFTHSAAVSLEELILRQALGMELDAMDREAQAGGVMMIPIPKPGVLTGVRGLDEARAVPGIEDVEITARLNYPLLPLPEGESYLGFIFARAETPAAVEAALRAAHARLRFEIEAALSVEAGSGAG